MFWWYWSRKRSHSRSHVSTNGQSVSLSWCWDQSGAHDRTLVTVRQLRFFFVNVPVSDERTGLSFVRVATIKKTVVSLYKIFIFHMLLHGITMIMYVCKMRARGTVVVKALCYKPKGRGFETRWGEFFFFNLHNPSCLTRTCGSPSL
jgi:hypothetical protein